MLCENPENSTKHHHEGNCGKTVIRSTKLSSDQVQLTIVNYIWVLDVSKNHNYLAYGRLCASLCNMLAASVWVSFNHRSPLKFRDDMVVEATCESPSYRNRGYQHNNFVL